MKVSSSPLLLIYSTIPFILFILGYYAVSLFVGTETCETPDLVGRRLTEVIAFLAPYQVQFSLLGEVEDAALPEGTVLSQRPKPGQLMKRYQSIGIVVSKQPAPLLAPALSGRPLAEVQALLESQVIKPKYWYLESKYPANTCIAQYPAAGEQLQEKRMDVYISSGASSVCMMPDFKGKNLAEAMEFLAPHGVSPQIFPADLARHRQCSSCIITAQKPLAGSWVDLKRPPVIQLSVEHNNF